MTTWARTGRGAAIALALTIAATIGITPKIDAAPKGASLSVIHVALDDPRTDVVDVYADERRIFNNLKPGQLRGVRVPQGTYDLTVFSDGTDPKADQPLLRVPDLQLSQRSNVTLALHRDAQGSLTTTTFQNGSTRNPVGQGRLTIRHIAVAPEVDVRLDGTTLFLNLANATEASARVPAGVTPLDVLRSGSDEVVISPRLIPVNRPLNTIVYLWGSADQGLRLAAQRVPLKR